MNLNLNPTNLEINNVLSNILKAKPETIAYKQVKVARCLQSTSNHAQKKPPIGRIQAKCKAQSPKLQMGDFAQLRAKYKAKLTNTLGKVAPWTRLSLPNPKSPRATSS